MKSMTPEHIHRKINSEIKQEQTIHGIFLSTRWSKNSVERNNNNKN